MKKKIQIIDLFAGPGGLGEGFSNCMKNSPFEIAMSVEKEPNAHKTLTLRAFFRKIKDKSLYEKYVKSRGQKEKQAVMKEIEATEEWSRARAETLEFPHALGNSRVFEKWKNNEIPTEDDFKDRTAEQREIDTKIEEISRASKRKARRSLKNCDPLIVIGGPPCQSYSTIGRARNSGIENYNQDHDEKFFLYQEYADVIKRARPDIFVMENVSGIGSARLGDGSLIFPKIIKLLEFLTDDPHPRVNKSYNIYSLVVEKENFIGTEEEPSEKDFLISAVDFGVPQARKRVILLGIHTDHDKTSSLSSIMKRNDFPTAPSTLDVLTSLPKIRSSISQRKPINTTSPVPLDSDENWQQSVLEARNLIKKLVSGKQSTQRGVNDVIYWDTMCQKLKYAKEIAAPEELTTDFIERVELPESEVLRIEANRSKYEEIISRNYPKILEKIETIQLEQRLGVGSDYYLPSRKTKVLSRNSEKQFPELERWFQKDFTGVLNHCAKKHTPNDLTKYIFSAIWTDVEKTDPPPDGEPSPSPLTKFFPRELASEHRSWFTRNFQDRFRTFASSYRAKTITSHLHKDGHANIHYDSAQCRSLTVREAARLQTFPDDYYFEGGQSAQYLQVGNAVPPFLAKQIANHVLAIMKDRGIY